MKHAKSYAAMTPKAKKFVSSEIRKQIRKGKPQQQAVAIAFSVARKKGYKVPKAPNPDVALRELERAAAAGDPEAKRKLRRARARTKVKPTQLERYVAAKAGYGTPAAYVSPFGDYGEVPFSELAMAARIAGERVRQYALWAAAWEGADPTRASTAAVLVEKRGAAGRRIFVHGTVAEMLPDEVRRKLGGFGRERIPQRNRRKPAKKNPFLAIMGNPKKGERLWNVHESFHFEPDPILGYVAWARDGSAHRAKTPEAAGKKAYAKKVRGKKRKPVLVMARKRGGETMTPGVYAEYSVPVGYYEPPKTTKKKRTTKKKTKRKKNPYLAMGNPKIKAGSTIQLRGKAAEKAAKRYKKFHGSAPKHATVVRIDDGKKKKTRKVVVALGVVPETHYEVPWKSNKEGHYWVHPHPAGDEPLEVLDVETELTFKIPGSKTKVTDWWHG